MAGSRAKGEFRNCSRATSDASLLHPEAVSGTDVGDEGHRLIHWQLARKRPKLVKTNAMIRSSGYP